MDEERWTRQKHGGQAMDDMMRMGDCRKMMERRFVLYEKALTVFMPLV